MDKLRELERLVGGRGCVVRHGAMAYAWGDQARSSDLASAFKPLLTTLLFIALQERTIWSLEDRVATFEPRLESLNNGKDAAITWRHFAFQISGYGLIEHPGEAYSYNDYALALYYDTLIQRVFAQTANRVLQSRLAEPLQFQDSYTFEAFGPGDRPGRLALSVRDFARFGLLYLRDGKWGEKQIIDPKFVRMALDSPLPPNFPRTSGKNTQMLPKQRSIGGTRNITPVGPGYYSFNWWLNRTNQLDQRLFVDAPPDTCVAAGHGGMRMLWLIPSLDMVVVWNDGHIEDQDQSPGNPGTKCNRAAKLIKGALLPESRAD
jgi:CubicO group peptidase (beta-lactamase class C family)